MLEGPQKPIKVAICMAAGDEVKTFFMYDLARLTAYTTRMAPEIVTAMFIATGSLVMKQRQTLAKSVVDDPSFTHTLWLDTDMRFPKDLLLRLLKHNVPVVCGSYTARNAPFMPTAFLDAKDWSKRAWVTAESTGLRQIIASGFGCVLVETDVFRKMPKPWFNVGWNRSNETFLGEDIYFYLQLNGLGIPLWLDQDVTKELAHIGRFEFTPEHAIQAEARRQAVEAEPSESPVTT